MVRYVSIIGDSEFETLVKQRFEGPVWCLDKKPPEVPYIKLKIKIIEKEDHYARERRPRKPKKRRFLIFGKEK